MSALSPEFALLAACCRWPRTQTGLDAIRQAMTAKIDWTHFCRLVKFHRVAGLVQDGFAAAACAPPEEVAKSVAAMALGMARHSLLLAHESVRLQTLFDQAAIPVQMIKGAALGQLAYGAVGLKHSRDIDLLVAPDDAVAAVALLQKQGYVYAEIFQAMREAQLRCLIGCYKEVPLMHPDRKLIVEILWRPALNRYLCDGLTVRSPHQSVAMPGGGALRTPASAELLVYLSVHGAMHGWERLKWLADFHALLVQLTPAEHVKIWQIADARGSRHCLQQACDLCADIFAYVAPDDRAEQSNRRTYLRAFALAKLTRTARATLLSGRIGLGSALRPYLWRLGQGWRFWRAQIHITLVPWTDVVYCPLPPYLSWLYPLLRVPLFFARRLFQRFDGY